MASRALKSELIDMVKSSKNISEKQSFEPFSGSDMRYMMLVLNAFLSALFAMDITGEKARNRLSSLARLYLCIASKLDLFLLNKKSSWLSTFSLLGLLRVGDTTELAPFPICFYEGDGMGEGIVKEIRPLLLTGLRKGWTMAGQDTYYRMKTLSYMRDFILTKETCDIATGEKKPVRGKIKVYKYIHDIETALQCMQPFCFGLFHRLFSEETVIGVLLHANKEYHVRVLNVAQQETFQDPSGFAYFKTTINPVEEHLILDKEKLDSIQLSYVATGIALPFLQEGVFAFILSDGRKKVPGENHIFSPSTVNKNYTVPKTYNKISVSI